MQTRDTQLSIIRATRERLRAELAAQIPLNPDRDWQYENLREEVEDYEGPFGDGLTIIRM